MLLTASVDVAIAVFNSITLWIYGSNHSKISLKLVTPEKNLTMTPFLSIYPHIIISSKYPNSQLKMSSKKSQFMVTLRKWLMFISICRNTLSKWSTSDQFSTFSPRLNIQRICHPATFSQLFRFSCHEQQKKAKKKS